MRDFWEELETRRNLCLFSIVPGWPLFELIGAILMRAFGANESGYHFLGGVILLATWYACVAIAAIHLRKLVCPRCSQTAVRHACFFMRDAECQHCKLAYRDRASRYDVSHATE